MKNLFYLLLMVGMTTMISCKGEQGDPGPAGVAGQDGIDGVDGVDGVNGTNGNANVKNYNTTISSSSWITESSDRLYVNLAVPIITQEIVNTGLVMVYTQDVGSQSWYASPFSYSYSGGSQSYHFEVSTGNIRYVSSSFGSSPYSGSLNVRIIAATSTGLAQNPDLDWTNFEAVNAALNLAD